MLTVFYLVTRENDEQKDLIQFVVQIQDEKIPLIQRIFQTGRQYMFVENINSLCCMCSLREHKEYCKV
jgi:hypothetical protein